MLFQLALPGSSPVQWKTAARALGGDHATSSAARRQGANRADLRRATIGTGYGLRWIGGASAGGHMKQLLNWRSQVPHRRYTSKTVT
jgi:hypothetical protein